MTTSSTSSLGSADVEEGEEGDQLYRKLDDVDEISLDFLELSDVIKEGEVTCKKKSTGPSQGLLLRPLHASQILLPTEPLPIPI